MRKALRIAEPDGKNGLNDDGNEIDIRTIKEKTSAFRTYLVSDEKQKQTYAKMIEQLDKYWDKLFADPITVSSETGQQKTIQPQRTNNILERFFRGEKRRSRKKSGTSSLNKTLTHILADTPFVRNLENEEYRCILLNGCSPLAERFSQIDEKMVQEELKKAQASENRIPKTLKEMIRQTDLPSQISQFFLRRQKRCQLSFADIDQNRLHSSPEDNGKARYRQRRRSNKICLAGGIDLHITPPTFISPKSALIILQD